MTEFVAGQSMVLQWITTTYGTVNLATAFTTCNYTPNIEKVDVTSGADTYRTYISSFQDATASVTMYEQTGGTALASALGAGVMGTLIIGPYGTATGQRKITMPAMSDGAQYTYPFAGAAEITVNFSSTAANTNGAY